MAISNTRLTTFKRCRLKYHWNYSGTGPQPKPSKALRRGSAGHLAMAAYYRGDGPSASVAAAWDYFDPNCQASLDEMLKLDAVLDRYFKWVRTIDNWRVLKIEESIEVEYAGEKLMGIWDLLVEVQGKRFIVDHKFQKSRSFAHLEVDPQVTHYLAISQLAGVEAHGVIYNIINLQPGNGPGAYREIATRTRPFLKAYLDGLASTIDEIRKLDAGEIPVYPNWTKDCSWDCGFYRKCLDEPYGAGGSDGETS